MKTMSRHTVSNTAAFAAFILLAAFALWLWCSTEASSEIGALARLAAVFIAVVSACCLGLVPALRCARLPVVRIIAAMPMGALIFALVSLALLLIAEAISCIYDWGRRVPPDWLAPVFLFGVPLIALIVSTRYVSRDLRKGSNKRDEADGLPPMAHQ